MSWLGSLRILRDVAARYYRSSPGVRVSCPDLGPALTHEQHQRQTMKRQILLDLDGVLGDCVGDMLVRYGLPRERQTEVLDYRNGLPNLLADACGASRVWPSAGKDEAFWSGMTLQPWAERLVVVCRSLADTAICTKPLPFGPCAAGKLEWCGHEFGGVFADATIITTDKATCARPGTILIDDAEHEVDAFREAGGDAILFPAPWNHRREHFGGRGVRLVIDELRQWAAEPCHDCARAERCPGCRQGPA